jgi:hypothetical protein
LAGGLYLIVYMAASFIPLRGISTAQFEFINSLFYLAMMIGLIAPVVAIIGAVLLRIRGQRFKALDWVSLAVGISAVLLPALIVYAYSNCPNRVC